MSTRRYSELILLPTFIDRFRYLSLRGLVGEMTFGSDRWLNQAFYRSAEWKEVRDIVIFRDSSCDLGMLDKPIHERIHIHHMNPMTVEDLDRHDPSVLDPEFLISVSHRTHNAIHYGNENSLPRPPIDRRPGDTSLR